ncbi:hypothetical protein [Corynebacterium epidermidicanis]|uniref:Small integral membrane protein (DUF2273) n=1 Tax=Corynebacterium epidermidicanis TaxID=1050174 RepID=A0A0G3GRV2_9CORY|nr:hypothetical protein [Corynebacterium epidermidicanis]AKK02263.1 hypothetical protein CEPID_01910 [Corynebacterium epidermidicanis]
MSKAIVIGTCVGFVLAFATILGGFSGLLLAVLFGALGGLAGAQFDGRVDVRRMLDALRFGGRG